MLRLIPRDNLGKLRDRVDVGKAFQIDGNIVVIFDFDDKLHDLNRLQIEILNQVGTAGELRRVLQKRRQYRADLLFYLGKVLTHEGTCCVIRSL
mgnify:CR=1 FL=1